MRRLLLIAALAVSAALVACGGESGGHEGHDTGSESGSVPGEAAQPSDATQTIEVSTLDQLRFDPATIDVSAGEVVKFVITNEGKSDHEFVLGDAAYQEQHGEEMDHAMTGDNAVQVSPGETKEVTWRFDEAGEVLYGCHIDGHYDGGMVGTIEVS